MTDATAALATRIRDDLDRIAHPRASWLTPRRAPDGTEALDVLVVGAGQSGVVTGFGLKRAKVDNVLVIDKAPRGEEGPWVTYARMKTLRSPKDFTGPDLDIPSLTYQSWHEARYGATTGGRSTSSPARTGTPICCSCARRDGGEGRERHRAPVAGGCRRARRRAGAGPQRRAGHPCPQGGAGDGPGFDRRWWMPDFIEALPKPLRAHTADAIDFAALKGKVVAVLGAGASALDNAATALEAGAASVHLFCRRLEPQVIQPYRWITFRGFMKHLADLDDAWRWRFMARVLGLREGFPQATYDRCAAHRNFVLIPARRGRMRGRRATAPW